TNYYRKDDDLIWTIQAFFIFSSRRRHTISKRDWSSDVCTSDLFFGNGLLIYLAIKKDMEPSLLLPMGFGAILVNLPLSGAIDQMRETGLEVGALDELFRAGISNELFPLLLFIGIGAMIDFGPLLTNPKLLLFGAAAQFGIFVTMPLACCVNAAVPGMFTLQDAASIGIIGAADGPTAIFVGNYFGTKYMGAIIVAAYSYMALVPIIQPP